MIMLNKLSSCFFVLSIAFCLNTVAAQAQTPDDACKKGEAALAKKDYSAAVKEFNDAITLNAEFAEAYLGRSIAEYNLGQLEDAMTDINVVIVFNPNSAEAYNTSGLIREKMNQLPEAEKDYEKALLLKPDFTEAKLNLAALRKKLGK